MALTRMTGSAIGTITLRPSRHPYPGLQEGRALYRHWANEFETTGYTFAMPVLYTWSRMWRWYDFEDPDYRWFRPMLLEGSSCARSTPAGLPIVAFVHWHTTVPPTPPDPAMKQFTVEGYQEFLWHMLLRGVSTFYLWCPAPEYADEVKALYPVWAAAQEYGEFLSKGRPVAFDVPERPGTVISGLQTEEPCAGSPHGLWFRSGRSGADRQWPGTARASGQGPVSDPRTEVAADVSRRHLRSDKHAPTDVGGYILLANRAVTAI